MRRMAVAVLAGAHRLTVDGDVTLVLAFGAHAAPSARASARPSMARRVSVSVA
jgi:hypothetical protein